MKKNLLLLLVATMFAACMTDDTNQVDWSGNVPINISVEQSRANDSTFERGDQIGLYVVNSESSTLFSSGNYVDNMCFELSNDWTPSQTIYWIDQTTKLDMYAYYPYGNPTNVTAYPFSVLSDQSNESKYFASDFLWGKRTNVVPTTNKVAIATEHLFSNALVYIVAGEGVTAEELAAYNIEVKVCNVKLDAKINLATGAVEAIGETGDITPWYTGSYYRAMIVPQSVSSSNELVNIKVGGEEYTYSTDMTFERGTRHKVTVTISRPTTPDTPSNGLSVNFTIEEWKDDNIDHGGDAVKKEEGATPKDFAVTFSNKTPLSADATISILDATKQDMVWGAFTFGESALVVEDWNTGQVSTKTPEEYAAEQLALLTNTDPINGYGFPGIYTAFATMGEYGGEYYLSEKVSSFTCSLLGMFGGIEKKMYLAVVGIDKNNANLETEVDDSKQATSIHIFEVETLPQPEVVVSATENVVEATAGTFTLDVTVNNPYGEGSYVTAGGYSVPEWLTVEYADGKVTATYEANPYAKVRTVEFDVTYAYPVTLPMYGEMMTIEATAIARVKVEQKANPDVTPVTFEITVKETHFDRIVVDVTPSDANAYYIVGAETKGQVDGYFANYGGWNAICEYTLGNPVHQGTLTDHVININTKWAEGADDWIYYVYAFQTDADSAVVAGEPAYVETPVTNDTPKVVLKHSALTVDGNDYTLDVIGQGGEYTIDFDFENPVANGKLRLNAYPYVTEKAYTSNGVLGNEGMVTIDNENKKITFTVNDYPETWDKSFDPYVSIVFIYDQFADDEFKGNTYGSAINLKIVLKKAE